MADLHQQTALPVADRLEMMLTSLQLLCCLTNDEYGHMAVSYDMQNVV